MLIFGRLCSISFNIVGNTNGQAANYLKGDKLYRKMPPKKSTNQEADKSAALIKNLQFQLSKMNEEKAALLKKLQNEGKQTKELIPILKSKPPESQISQGLSNVTLRSNQFQNKPDAVQSDDNDEG